MKVLETAIQLDINEQIQAAAHKYEEALMEPGVSLDAFLNLAFVYWESTELGFNAHHRLDLDFIKYAGERYDEILNTAGERFGPDARILLWRQYFAAISLGASDPSIQPYLPLVSSGSLPLEIYFHLYIGTQDPQYLPEIKQLLTYTKQHPTIRNRYVASVLESAIWQFGHESLFSKL